MTNSLGHRPHVCALRHTLSAHVCTQGGADLGYDPELMTYVPEEEHIPSLDSAIKAAIGGWLALYFLGEEEVHL